MPSRSLPLRDEDAHWARVSDIIAANLGLHFPRSRLTDLQRGLTAAARELGFGDAACAEWLLSEPLTRTQWQAVASHLTIGETYFFRERKTFDVLANRVLPDLIHARRGREQRLRLWSAGCCSGEEAYSLAILLQQILPDLADWQVTIVATDVNPRFLQKAVGGSYGEWSFRGSPPGFKERYFDRVAEGQYTVRPEIRRLVSFEHLNLVEDVYPSLATDTNAMDLIFCRNVLMYFTAAQMQKVIGNLHHALIDGGWLAVSPSEASQVLFTEFVTRNFPGVILYLKTDAASRRHATPARLPDPATARPLLRPANAGLAAPPHPPVPPESPVSSGTRPMPSAAAASLYQQGRYREAAETLLTAIAQETPAPNAFSLLARALANQGRLADALGWCDRWIAAEKLNPASHYVRAMVLLEQGALEEARRSLQRAVYLDSSFVLAHFALGNLARTQDKDDEAQRHFANSLHLLARLQPHDPLPESDGLTAGRLTETITALTALGRTR